MTKGRGAQKHNRGSGRGSQSGRLKKDSLHIISSRSVPKYAPTHIEGMMEETAGLMERLRNKLRRKKR